MFTLFYVSQLEVPLKNVIEVEYSPIAASSTNQIRSVADQ